MMTILEVHALATLETVKGISHFLQKVLYQNLATHQKALQLLSRDGLNSCKDLVKSDRTT